MSKQAQLQQLGQSIIESGICPGLSEYASGLVMGDGNADASIVFIGEAPGKKEDEQGVPFVGASGRLLGELLTTVGLSREEVYITNIVKYRPPNNRDPTNAEKLAFLPYLIKELEIVSPQIIITLGRHSMQYFLPTAKIGEIHGQMQSVQIENVLYSILPLYHPAAALYNGSLRQTLKDDFIQLSGIDVKAPRSTTEVV